MSESLTKEVTFEQKPAGGEGATGKRGGRAFWAKGTAGAKALRWVSVLGETSMAGAKWAWGRGEE